MSCSCNKSARGLCVRDYWAEATCSLRRSRWWWFRRLRRRWLIRRGGTWRSRWVRCRTCAAIKDAEIVRALGLRNADRYSLVTRTVPQRMPRWPGRPVLQCGHTIWQVERTWDR